MGCGSSGNVVVAEQNELDSDKMANSKNGTDNHNDDLPTVVLPDTPMKAKPPIAYEIPIEEFDGNRKTTTPPPHVQRLLQPPAQEISLPDIEEKLAEAEQRRQLIIRERVVVTEAWKARDKQQILQQRASSALKRQLKNTKHSENDSIANEHSPDEKHSSSILTISPQPGMCVDKNIS